MADTAGEEGTEGGREERKKRGREGKGERGREVDRSRWLLFSLTAAVCLLRDICPFRITSSSPHFSLVFCPADHQPAALAPLISLDCLFPFPPTTLLITTISFLIRLLDFGFLPPLSPQYLPWDYDAP